MDRRYFAQGRLPGWSQQSLSEGTALIIGVGGLGLPAALYLAAMGIGRLILADPDTVAEENLHRQPLYTTESLGKLKVDVLAAHLRSLRPDLGIELHPVWADEEFLLTVGRAAHIWIDGTDNLQSRLAIDRAASALRKPWVYGAIFQAEGQVALLEGVSYTSLFGEGTEGPSCSEAGVIGALPGIIGSWQATLAAQYLAWADIVPKNRLFRIDLRRGEIHTFWLSASVERLEALEISLEEVRLLQDPLWIDIREEASPPPPFAGERRAWYDWDKWSLPPKPIVILCEAGNRSRQIAYALRKLTGRKDIYSLRQGSLGLMKSE
ncbi:MAG: HesA/MoeB/ThiF family protein [Bacteroidia bacterium]|nr:HesA/MoeB/ThiF family protein [Bacteroidia bacterium]